MRKGVLGLALFSWFAFAQQSGKLDPCGSPSEFYSKRLLDMCYKGYFDAILEAKKLAEESKKIAEEANKKAKDLENRTRKLEDTMQTPPATKKETVPKKEEAPKKEDTPASPTVKEEAPKKEDTSVSPAPKKEESTDRKYGEEVSTVYFNFNSFDIRPAEARKLDDLVKRLKEEGREVLIIGFSDKKGAREYNFNLSMWRAQIVASYFVKKGVDIGKIRIAFYGEEVSELFGHDSRQQRAVKVYLIK